MKHNLNSLILAASLIVMCAAPAGASEAGNTQDLLNTSNDYLELVREYWPKIRLGDSQAMAVSYDALNNCGHFRSEIEAAETIDDLDNLLSGRSPEDLRFAKGIYFKCKTLVQHYAEFPGWRDLRLRAALAGDIRSRVFVTLDFYRYRNERPRELLAFSPAEFLIEAMRSGDTLVFDAIGALGVKFGLRLDTATTTSVAWQLVSCRLRGNCGDPSSMSVFCAFMTSECARWKNAYEYLEHQAGGEENYAIARQKAEDIYSRIQQRRFDELDLDLVW